VSEKPIIGIDFGTTNSEVAIWTGGRIEVVEEDGQAILPSYVGLDPAGRLLVGAEARNQYALYPDHTVRSVKRRLGNDEKITLGERTYVPQEIAAIILRELKARAERRLGEPVERAVITVPAQASDAQRQATREAGRIAGLDVVRIVNEPTAACLAYESAKEKGAHTILAFDLGGGTFDVSIVRVEDDVIEVLTSHGDNHLGGEDIDALIAGWIRGRLRGQELPEAAYAGELTREADYRIHELAERAKIHLTDQPYAGITAANLRSTDGAILHLDTQLSRLDLEPLIEPLLRRMRASVQQALSGARMLPGAIEEIILVGGATRMPVVQELLEEIFGRRPRRDVHPELAVAYGAGVMAARLMGEDQRKVLIDITPYTFGTSALGEIDGKFSEHCFVPVITAGTPLPVSKAKLFATVVDEQDGVDVRIYQGERQDARENLLIGRFFIRGLAPVPAGNEVLIHMALDLDGILRVTATEKSTGFSKDVRIENALAKLSSEEIEQARAAVSALFGEEVDPLDATAPGPASAGSSAGASAELPVGASAGLPAGASAGLPVGASAGLPAGASAQADGAGLAQRQAARHLIKRLADLRPEMDEVDCADADQLMANMKRAIEAGDGERIEKLTTEIEDLLFYLEVDA